MYEDEIQEWIEYATGKRIMIGVRSTEFTKKMGFDKKKAEETYVGLVGLFLQETLLILVTHHPRNGMRNKA